jgi:UDP-N-acetylmuramyl tripeptide synthase
MKKFLIVLGSIFLAIVVLGAIGIAFVAVRGAALDKESKAYADSAIPAIVTTWSKKELLDRASPEFKKAVAIDQLDRLFGAFATLGRLQKCEPAQGQSLMSATTQNGKTISGQYTAKATFEKGEATIKLGLIKHGDQWQILGFHVDSPVFMPR